MQYGCPNGRCPHFWHDIEDFGDPIPVCCEEGCSCGKTDEDKRIREVYFSDESRV